jgi:hypothetical protein
MNRTLAASALIAAAALASTASFAAGGEANYSEHQSQAVSLLSRGSVAAEAAKVSSTRNFEPAGSRVAAPVVSSVARTDVRAQTVAAVRSGQTVRGEIGRVL